MTNRFLTLPTPDGDMSAYEAVPDGEARGGLVVVQEAFGVNDHIQDVTRRAAAAGWHAVSPALFHRTGDPELSYGDFGAIAPHMQALSEQAILDDIDAALAHLAAAGFPAARTGIVGFCMGGSIALLTAARRRVGAAVTFYGGGLAEGRFGMPPGLELAAALQSPWLGLFGDLDSSIPTDQVDRAAELAAAADVPAQVVRYPEADHGFHCDARPQVFNAEAASDGWSRAMGWLDTHVTS